MNVSRLDFKRLKHKYTESSEAEMSAAEWDFAEQEYRRFLTLKCFYPSVALVPSKMVDTIWHAHILDMSKQPTSPTGQTPKPAPRSVVPNLPSTTGNKSGGGRGNYPSVKSK